MFRDIFPAACPDSPADAVFPTGKPVSIAQMGRPVVMALCVGTALCVSTALCVGTTLCGDMAPCKDMTVCENTALCKGMAVCGNTALCVGCFTRLPRATPPNFYFLSGISLFPSGFHFLPTSPNVERLLEALA